MKELVPLLVFQLLASLAAYGAIGWWFVRPWLATKPRRTALSILLLPQLFRHVGVTMLVTEVVDPTLPSAFARQTASGDVLAMSLAWVALIALRMNSRAAIALVWLFNVVGLADMVTNLANGARLQVAEHLGAAWLGIVFIVPAMLVVHSLVFAFLLRRPERAYVTT
jgi:hypothetical protein